MHISFVRMVNFKFLAQYPVVFLPIFVFWLFIYLFIFVDACIVCIVSGRSNQFSVALFDIVFESLYRCIDAIFYAGKSSSSFSWYIQSVYVISGM